MNWFGVLLCMISFHALGGEMENAETLLLEVSLNGRPTERVVQFTRRGHAIFATAANLRSLGIGVSGENDALLSVSGFARDIRLDPTALTINIDLPMRLLDMTEVTAATRTTAEIPLAENTLGALLNYDFLATRGGNDSMGGYFDGRLFSGNSVFSSTGLTFFADSPVPSARLDTTYTYSNPRDLTRYRIGDFIGSGLFWTRPVRFGGAQFGTDFSLRPDLIITPTPSLGGEAVVPSTVDLYLNGVRQLSQPLPPGPFEIRQTPIVTGAGQLAVALTDELGRQTYRTVSFYASDKLLKKNLSSFTLESGWIRRRYGLRSNHYGNFAMAGTARHGLDERLTLETHAEAVQGMLLAGGGLALNISDWGVLSGAVSAVSSEQGKDQQRALGFERTTSVFSISATHIQSGPRYRDIGAVEGAPVARSTTTGAIGLNLADHGAISLAYASAIGPILLFGSGGTVLNDSKSVTLSYFKPVSRGANLYVTGFRDFRHQGYGVAAGVVMPFGGGSAGGAGVSSNNGMRTASVQASRATVSPGDVGWQLQTTEGAYRQRYAEVDYKGSRSRAMYAVAQTGHVTSRRAGVRGALVWMDDTAFLSNWIDDSFAVVNTQGARGVGVFSENRFAGRTDDNGRLLLTDLRAYDINKIAVDELDLPLTLHLDQSEQLVKPPDRSGAVVTFKTQRTSNVRLTLKLRNGQFVPVGSTVTLRDNGQVAPVGFEGVTYLSELGNANTLDVRMPSGETCRAELTKTRTSGGDMRSITLECHP